ncbi:GNAT family N-acetyltransferase [Sulfuriroseicoccus oceanibius]|uniref:N-acetyltransferase n=1 Tax=Sulfuriroseicoccus oceanibius TaxID=2707525 RepID=A0A6B3LDF4_9BACT|nr:N-acetyltransferase [Sulfuriroseicoccus oceanibius]QQL45844.1 N-acetyltransferase [Sulfuriroseicoccus oceanibius]
MVIRPASQHDKADIEALYRSAFPEEEWEKVAKLATDLLDDDAQGSFSLVIDDEDDQILGHVAFSEITIPSEPETHAAILAPLAVHPDAQRQGVGTALVNHGLDILTEEENNLVFVYGDPEYYGRFGFTVEPAENFRPPYELQFPKGWQVLALTAEAPPEDPIDITCAPALQDPTLW